MQSECMEEKEVRVQQRPRLCRQGVRQGTCASYSRTSRRSSVDLPEPLGPTIAQLCPASTVRSTPLSTGLPGWYLRMPAGKSFTCHALAHILLTDLWLGIRAHPNVTFESSTRSPLPELLGMPGGPRSRSVAPNLQSHKKLPSEYAGSSIFLLR